MSTTSYGKVALSYKIISEYFKNVSSPKYDTARYTPLEVDVSNMKLEFDEFIIENPELYLDHVRKYYFWYKSISYRAKLMANTVMRRNASKPESERNNFNFFLIVNIADEIVKYLNGILPPATEELDEESNVPKTQESPNPISSPKGKTVLTREQTALFFWYLRERELIAQPTNENIAHSINMLTGHSKKQIQDIIKSQGTPAFLLGKDNNRVTRNDFRTVLSALEKLIEKIKTDYKTYSDTNELR